MPDLSSVPRGYRSSNPSEVRCSWWPSALSCLRIVFWERRVSSPQVWVVFVESDCSLAIHIEPACVQGAFDRRSTAGNGPHEFISPLACPLSHTYFEALCESVSIARCLQKLHKDDWNFKTLGEAQTPMTIDYIHLVVVRVLPY